MCRSNRAAAHCPERIRKNHTAIVKFSSSIFYYFLWKIKQTICFIIYIKNAMY